MSAWPVLDEYATRGGDWDFAAEIRDAIESELDRQHAASGCRSLFTHRKWGTVSACFSPDFDKIAVAVAERVASLDAAVVSQPTKKQP